MVRPFVVFQVQKEMRILFILHVIHATDESLKIQSIPSLRCILLTKLAVIQAKFNFKKHLRKT